VTLTRAASSTCGRAKSNFKFRLLTEAGLKKALHAYGTNIVGAANSN